MEDSIEIFTIHAEIAIIRAGFSEMTIKSVIIQSSDRFDKIKRKEKDMKKISRILVSSSLLFTILTSPIWASELRYQVGKVQSISNRSKIGLLSLQANVPDPTESIQHQIAGYAYAQNCPIGEECYDIAYDVYSDWDSYGASIYKHDESHGNYNRNPRVVGYR